MRKKIDEGFRVARFISIHSSSVPSKNHIIQEVPEGKTPKPWCGTVIAYAYRFSMLKEPGVDMKVVSCQRCERKWNTRLNEESF